MNTTKRTDRKQFAEAACSAIFHTIVTGLKSGYTYPVVMACADTEVQAQRTATAKDAARDAVALVRDGIKAAGDAGASKQTALADALREIAKRANITNVK
jgi:hypothetical protein